MIRANEELPPGWLTGRVVGGDLQPIADATISTCILGPSGRNWVRTQSASDGRFRFGPLPATPAAVMWFEAKGFGRVRIGDDQAAETPVFPDGTHELGDIELPPEGVVAGKVADPSGNPMAGVAVTVTSFMQQLAHTIAPNGPAFEARTLADGSFRVGSLPTGLHRIEVNAPGYPRKDLSAKATLGGELDLGTILLEGGRIQISGRVVDTAGVPVSGAIVAAERDDDWTTTTDGDGRFTLQARATKVRFASASVPGGSRRLVLVENPNDILFTVPPVHVLEGVIRDARTGEPVAIDQLDICEVRRREVDGTEFYVG